MTNPRLIWIDTTKTTDMGGEWYDDEKIRSCSDDELYVKESEILEYLVTKGWNLTLSGGPDDEIGK